MFMISCDDSLDFSFLYYHLQTNHADTIVHCHMVSSLVAVAVDYNRSYSSDHPLLITF